MFAKDKSAQNEIRSIIKELQRIKEINEQRDIELRRMERENKQLIKRLDKEQGRNEVLSKQVIDIKTGFENEFRNLKNTVTAYLTQYDSQLNEKNIEIQNLQLEKKKLQLMCENFQSQHESQSNRDSGELISEQSKKRNGSTKNIHKDFERLEDFINDMNRMTINNSEEEDDL